MSGALAGRSAILTGGSHGLGLAIARAYLDAGANVLFCARNPDALDHARRWLEQRTGNVRVLAMTADVSRQEDVRKLVSASIDAFERVDILVNNAGIQGPIGRLDEVDWNEWEHTVRVNLIGSALCCREVLPHFRANGYGKIVQLSGGGATSPRPLFGAYASSKAAVVRFAETLAEEVADWHIDVNAVAPGVLNTRLLDEILAAGRDRLGPAVYDRTLEHNHEGGIPLELVARLIVFLGSAASDGITGRLISAPWDPWETLSAWKAELATTDVYTLRRIVPADRGLDWGQPSWEHEDRD